MKKKQNTSSRNAPARSTLAAGSAVSTCCTCGWQWATGRDGSHSCAGVLLAKVDLTRIELNEIADDCDGVAKSGVSHSEARIWRLIARRLRALLPNLR